jgi:predicted metallopeptidase
VNALSLRPPIERFARSPELAPLTILESVLATCEAALFAAHPEVAHGALDICDRGSSAMRAHAILVATRRLATALAVYRETLGREERRHIREQKRDMPF